MQNISKYIKKITSSLFFLVVLFLPTVSGATTLAPMVIDAKIAPGESGIYELVLYNETDQDIVLNGEIEKFIPRGESGGVSIVSPVISDVAVTWIKLPSNSLFLKPGDLVSVPVVIAVPNTADVGGYYLAIMWETAPGPLTSQNQAIVTSRVGTLVLLEVTGETTSELELVDFELKETKSIYNGLPIEFSTRLRNTGNTHQRPEGSIIVKDFFGRTIDAPLFNPGNSAILPNTTRVFKSFWGDSQGDGLVSTVVSQFTNFAIGRFSAKAIITYGETDIIVSEEIYFWVIPWYFISILVIILILFLYIRKKIKRKIS